MKAAGKLLQAIEHQTGIPSGQVSEDGMLGVEVVRCIGACGMAPVVMVDNEMIPNANLDEVLAKIHEKTS